MSTSIAISSSASAASLAAQAQARKARKDACESVLNSFDAKGATVEHKKTYAECVQLLHPDPMTHSETFAMKGLFVVLLIGLVIGAIYGWQEDGPEMALLFGLLGAIVLPAGIVAVYGLGAGVVWLFS